MRAAVFFLFFFLPLFNIGTFDILDVILRESQHVLEGIQDLGVCNVTKV